MTICMYEYASMRANPLKDQRHNVEAKKESLRGEFIASVHRARERERDVSVHSLVSWYYCRPFYADSSLQNKVIVPA